MDEDGPSNPRRLPRRPSKNKPLLKYCQTPGPGSPQPHTVLQPHSVPVPPALNSGNSQRPAPVTLFSPNDIYGLYKNSISTASSINQSNHVYMASFISSTASSTLNPYGNYLFVSGGHSPGSGQSVGFTAGQLLSSAPHPHPSIILPPRDTQANGSPTKTPTSRISNNPYARPISAQDVVVESPMLLVKSPLAGGLRTSSSSSMNNGFAGRSNQKYLGDTSERTHVPIQTNSFMRPRSAMVEAKPTPPPSATSMSSLTPPKTEKMSQSQSEHSVIHVHMDHHRPAENGVPKPPIGNRPPGGNRPPAGNRPISGRKTSIGTIATTTTSGSSISNGVSTTRQNGGSATYDNANNTYIEGYGANRINQSPGSSPQKGSPLQNGGSPTSNNSTNKHMEGSPTAKLSNRMISTSPKMSSPNGIGSSPNLRKITNSPRSNSRYNSTVIAHLEGSPGVTPNSLMNGDRRTPRRDSLTLSNLSNNTTGTTTTTTTTAGAGASTNNSCNANMSFRPNNKLITSVANEHSNMKSTFINPQANNSSGESLSSDSRSSSAGSLGNGVRNPNYTPNKPYSEVTQPQRYFGNLPMPTVVTNIPTIEQKEKDRDIDILDTVKDILSTKPPVAPSTKMRNSPSLTEQLKDGSVKKMPVTGTLTGTIYYRKLSKAEEPIKCLTKSSVHRRPKADGALSVQRKEDGTEEWEQQQEENAEEEDDDSTVPSERSPGDGEAADESDDGHPASPPHHPVVDDEEDEGDDDEDDDEDDEDVEDPMDDDDDDADPKDDDELVDNIYDDEVESDDSDGYSLQSAGAASRQGSASTVRNLKSATKRLLGLSLETKTSTAGRTSSGQARPASASTSSTGDLQPALMPSLFPGVPPTVNFVPDGEKVEQLPWEIRKLLKWKMSPITPNVVKNCIARSGFRATKRNHDWIGYWGKHMKAPGFKAIREYQKVNHFPGSFQIGRKDRLWRNLSKMQVQFGKKEYGFFPQTFVLPYDIKQLKRAWEDGGNKQKWIIKPPASARGIGIKVINKWNQIPKRRPIIVQRYISRPLLIQESKFDIRLYVYVTSYDPLRIYVYDDGLARFASCKYSNSLKSLNNRYMHLTNYSINKKNTDYQNNSDENVCQGHKWGLKALWGYMKTQGINTGAVWESMKDVIIKTVIASEPYVNPMMKANARRRYCCHELFGFDIMLDDTLKPWLIEVNISPSLHSNSTLDINIKGGMIKDLLNIAGFQIPDKNDVKESPSNASANTGGASNKEQQENSNNNGAPVIYMDKRLFCGSLTPDERSKHAYYCQRHADEIIQQTILEVLTPDDVRMMVETVDEDSRRCSMQRIFPCNISHKYLRFFEQPRYYNLLLDAWVQKYNRMEQRGVAYLEFVCSRGVHLENPTDDPKHQWSPPNLSVPRDSRANSAPAKGLVPNSVLPKLRKKRIGALATSSTSSLPTPRHHPHPPSRNSQPSH